MSEYQYYEFLAVDRPLNADDQRALRAISSRARITATGFTNHYEWGNLKADPTRLLQRYFDLHVYVAICKPDWPSAAPGLRDGRRVACGPA